MSSAGISFSGLGSGLDTQSIISALLAVERRPLTALAEKKDTFKSQKNLFADLEGMLDRLQNLSKGLRESTSFLDFSANLDREDFLTATASQSASKGSHTIEVLELASAQVNHSLGKADADTTTFGTGTLEITIDGTSHFIDIDGTNNTLDGIAGAINGAGIDVQAQVLDTGSGATPFQLVLRGTETGTANAFTIALDTGTQELQDLVTELDSNVINAASDARFKVNGVEIFRPDNVVNDAIEGVTLNLKSGGSTGAVTTLTVGVDSSATADKVSDFADAYNEVVDFLEAQGQIDEEGNATNPLFGDSTLRSIRSSLRSIVGSTFDTGNIAYSMFAQIGINSDRDGRLTLNRDQLEEALETDESAVRNLFTDATNGIATRLYDQVNVYTDSVDGLIKTRQDGFDSQIKQTDNQIDQGERRLDLLEERLRTQFAALESLMAQLQGQGAALSSIQFGF